MAYVFSDWNTGHTLILFLSLSTGILCLPYQWYTQIRDVTYYDLLKLNVSCGELHSCHVRRSWSDDLRYFNCHCGPVCQELGTCCVDSKFRTSQSVYDTSTVSCNNMSGHSVLEVRGCRSDWDGDELVKDLCALFSFDDPFLSIPVTSTQSGITYRNYYCFVCNADVDTDRPIFWNAQLTSSLENISSYSLTDIKFNRDTFSYQIRGRNDYIFIYYEMPNRVQSLVRRCRQGYTINTCAQNWTDAPTKKKCEAYTAEIRIPCKDCPKNRTQRYRNPHCAICNFEDLSQAVCTFDESEQRFAMSSGIPGTLFVGLFSMEDRNIRCPRNTVLDTFTNSCRTFRCGRGTVMVDGNCVLRANDK